MNAPLQRLLLNLKMSNKIVISFSSKPTANLFYRLKWRGLTTQLTTNHLDFEVKIHQLQNIYRATLPRLSTRITQSDLIFKPSFRLLPHFTRIGFETRFALIAVRSGFYQVFSESLQKKLKVGFSQPTSSGRCEMDLQFNLQRFILRA